jgi:hypothetical protein
MGKWLLVIVRLDYSIHCVSSIWLFSSQGIPTSSHFVPIVFPLIFGDAALKVFGALIDAKSPPIFREVHPPPLFAPLSETNREARFVGRVNSEEALECCSK